MEQIIPSAVAIELQKRYKEILIDEYQDSNLVQETILELISGKYAGMPNRFMVGDVKQSIYRFRLAKPDLFIEKYNSFQQKRLVKSRESIYLKTSEAARISWMGLIFSLNN